MVGRPTDYTSEVLELAEQYINGGWEEVGDKVPTVAGLAMEIGRSRETCYAWANDPSKAAFSDILTRIKESQERALVNGGLGGTFNPAVTKMMMTKHGYSDKTDLTSSDGTMSQKPTTIELTTPCNDKSAD